MADLIGQLLLGRYRVDKFLGKGGMAEVYKVWDCERAVFLAMKTLYSDLAEDRVFLRRFEREAATLSSLEHPHIVRFYGLEHDNGHTYMLMDYVEGITLRKKIFDLQRPLSAQQILHVMQPVCSALYYAHERGWVHCDIKPANIMLKSNRDVLVADFGIARIMEGSTTTTMVGAGTPAYMAPEQVLGKKPIPQTDIYSLGIVLYEMLTGGERPFTGEQAMIEGTTSEKVRWEQTRLPPPSPRLNNPAISTELEKVVLTCLKKDSALRYKDALELLQALEFELDKLEETKHETSAEEPLGISLKAVNQPPRRDVPKGLTTRAKRRGVSTVIGLSLLLAVSILVMMWTGIISPPGSPTRLPTSPPTGTTNPSHVVVPPPTQRPTQVSTTTTFIEPTLTELAPTVLNTPQSLLTDAYGVEMVLVDGGVFTMGGNDIDAEQDEKPVRTVSLDAFYIDKVEVTNAQYKACVDAGLCKAPIKKDSFTRSSYYENPQFSKYPVVYVDWEMSRTYCEWRGARLPTEAEWEKAARGTNGLTYPWGDGFDCQKANYQGCVNGTSKVGSYESGKSPYGAYDMAGNVWEWVMDWYSETYYKTSLPSNPIGPDSGAARVLRGGSWNRREYDIRAANRNRYAPDYYNFDIGFRCAYSLEQ